MKKIFGVLFVLSLSFVFPKIVYAQYSASNVLGQFAFEDQNTISYTKSTDNGWGGVVNGYNLDRGDGDIVLDKTRNRLYVSDNLNNRVLVFDTDVDHNVPYGEQADYVLGQTNLTSSSEGVTDSTLKSATALALDETNGRLFVGDGENCRVLVFDVSGTITNGMAADNVLFQTNFTSSTCNSNFFWQNTNLNVLGNNGATGIAYDAANDYLYVSDNNKDRVLAVDVATITNGEAAQGILGDQTGDYSVDIPQGMTIDDAGQLFLTDRNKNRVLVYDISTFTSEEDPINVLGQSNFTGTSSGFSQSSFTNPISIDIDESSDLLAVGDQTGRLMIFDVSSITNGENATNILGRPNFTDQNTANQISASYTGTATYRNQTTFGISGVHWVDSNTLLAYNYARVMEFDTTSITDGEAAQNVWGQYDWGGNITTDTFGTDGEIPGPRVLSFPADVALDTVNNKLYVADYGNYRVLVFDVDATTHIPTDRVADYVLGQPNFTQNNYSSTINASTFSPISLAIDMGNQRLFVTDENNNRVLVFDVSTITNGEDAVYVLGQDDFTSNNYDGATDSDFEDPGQLYYSESDDWLFVADQYNYRVVMFNLSSSISNGMAASKVIGQPNFTTNTSCTVDASGLCDAEGQIEFDETNRTLFVSDPYDYRILAFVLPSDLSTMSNDPDASYVIGQSDFVSSDSTPVSTRLNQPFGITLANVGMLFAFDCNNNRVIAYDIRTLATDPTPMGVIGQANFTGTAAVTTQTGLNCSYRDGIEFDNENQRLFVADGDNARVLTYDLVNITTTTLPTATVGVAYNQTITTTGSAGTVAQTLATGSLPGGISISSVTGTPTTAGSYTFSVKATDDNGTIGSFFDIQEYSFTVQAASGNSGSSSSSGFSAATYTHSEESCSEVAVQKKADLFQIKTKNRQATLYFTPVPGISKYMVFYGLSGQPWQHSSVVEGVDDSGVVDHHIYHLEPNTEYDFFVVPYNGCAAGPESSTLSATTNYGIYHKYTDVVYENKDRGVVGAVLGAAAGWFNDEESSSTAAISEKKDSKESIVTKKDVPKVEAKTTDVAPSMEAINTTESSENLPWYQKLWNSLTGLFK